MSRTAERDFSSYYLGDDVYELAHSVIPDIAERLELELTDEPTTEVLGELVGKVGKNKVLRSNEPVQAIDLPTAVSLVERSGVQKPLSRSLWSPDELLPATGSKATVVTGAVANWQDRTATLLINAGSVQINRDEGKRVYMPIGNRVMGTPESPSEVAHPRVVQFKAEYGELPTEAKYAEHFLVPLLEAAGYSIDLLPYETGNGDEIAAGFVAERPELFMHGTKLTFARVANAGIQLAVQFRKAARELTPVFDGDLLRPDMYVQTDTFPLARTAEQVANAREFQSPYTALRQVVLTAKLLHEATADTSS
jgi:hypothetical protein